MKSKKLVCKHCGNKWMYKGKQKYYTTCPRCLYKVRVLPSSGRKKKKEVR